MTLRRYVVIRSGAPSREAASMKAALNSAPRSGASLRSALAPKQAERAAKIFKLESAALKPQEVKALRDKGGALVVAAMPLKLVAPVKFKGAAKLKAGAERRSSGGSHASGADAHRGLAAIGASTSAYRGQGVTVAVLDTGIDPKHEAFKGIKLTRKNFTTGSAEDVQGHGTHCAGTIVGRDVKGQRIGIARGVKSLMVGKVLGEGPGGSDVLARAVQWAAEGGAHVVSMSLGIDYPNHVRKLQESGMPVALAVSRALEDYRQNVLLFQSLMQYLENWSVLAQPILVIAAAGNESLRDQDAEFEVGVTPPAVAPGVIAVGALMPVDKPVGRWAVAPFSNTGGAISAPGVDVVSARVTSQGGGLVPLDGTSMAAPHVAGAAALWAERLMVERNFTTAVWRQRLLGTASSAQLVKGFDPSDVGAGMVQTP